MPERSAPQPVRIVSGGQTGVDRAALDAAQALGIQHGGWCPRGRKAEDGAIPARYALRETASPRYEERTRLNVADADATLILCRGTLAGGTQLTFDEARRLAKPCLVVDLGLTAPRAAQGAGPQPARPDLVRDWLRQHAVATLNVAGPRESQCPGICAEAEAFLFQVLGGDAAR